MRRLAQVLPVVLALPLLAGCPVSPCVEPTLEVRWSLQNLAGEQNVTCASVGVATVDVIVDSVGVKAGVACSAGATRVEALAPGAHRVTVEGRDASGILVDRDWYDTTLAECGTTSDTARPGEGWLRIAYGMSPLNQCWAEGDTTTTSGYMWFRLLDKAYGTDWAAVTASSSAASKVVFPCGNYASNPPAVTPITLNVPFGVYTLKWIKDVKFPAVDPPIRVDLYQMCTPTDVEVRSNAVKDLPVVLTPVTADTPACTL